ncbi:CAAX protease self-immunity [Mucilaginibacter pineti]|uniref:CAAX protease self-immunity n=1 Tax=Mucilaginibacter pineti TaxID=1391627 RepID=A0A1G6TEV3_9SPHI|nr:CPBP family intramembrane glutamic endopeptidase [Mucilaginibacter pineti]SDD26845.1 CAAX protease self-immunity [Mucilaginibacter pineti]
MRVNKWQRTVTDLFMIVFLIVFPHTGLLPMYAFSLLLLLLIWLYLRAYKENFSNIGFRFNAFTYKSLAVGGVIGIVYAVFTYWIISPVLTHLGFREANLSDFNYLRHNFFNYLFLLAIACFLVIPFEEILFRGFIFSRIKAMAGKQAFKVSGLITSVLFALYHYQEGLGAVISIFLFAIITIWLLKLFKGNLWYVIFFHITYDIFMLTAIYLGYM